jgi:hypothetical protein
MGSSVVSRVVSAFCFLICHPTWPIATRAASLCITEMYPPAVVLGMQEPSRQSHSDGTFLALIIRLEESRSARIENATEVPGKLIAPPGPSSKFIFEVTRDGQPFAVGFLPEDPFVSRSFPDPKTHRKEQVGQTKSATITLNIPDTNAAAAAAGRIGIRFYALRQGTDVRRIDSEVFKKLLADSKITLRFELAPSTISNKFKSQSPD